MGLAFHVLSGAKCPSRWLLKRIPAEDEAELCFFKKGTRARSCERPIPRPLGALGDRNEDSTSRMAE